LPVGIKKAPGAVLIYLLRALQESNPPTHGTSAPRSFSQKR